MTRTTPIPVIALLTDFGADDIFVGVMKGVIAGIAPEARVIDLCHEVTPFDAVEAALMLRDAYSCFPAGSIHVVVVDPGVGGERRIIAGRADSHVFVAPDTGVLWPVFAAHPPTPLVAVTNPEFFRPEISNTFHGRDIFAPVAAHLAAGAALSQLGPAIDDPLRLELPGPSRGPDGSITGQVMRADHFGNLITNIPAAMLADAAGREEITVTIAEQVLHGIGSSYESVPAGGFVALLGSSGMLEISVNRGRAADALGARHGAAVRVRPGD